MVLVSVAEGVSERQVSVSSSEYWCTLYSDGRVPDECGRVMVSSVEYMTEECQ